MYLLVCSLVYIVNQLKARSSVNQTKSTNQHTSASSNFHLLAVGLVSYFVDVLISYSQPTIAPCCFCLSGETSPVWILPTFGRQLASNAIQINFVFFHFTWFRYNNTNAINRHTLSHRPRQKKTGLRTRRDDRRPALVWDFIEEIRDDFIHRVDSSDFLPVRGLAAAGAP